MLGIILWTASDPSRRQCLLGSKDEESAKGGDLLHYFLTNEKREIHKWLHSFEIYERHFSRFRNSEVTVVEIGVAQGGSLQMWKDYFGPRARIVGIDIDERCKDLEEDQIEIFIGDQADREFLSRFKKAVPKIDILIDDGGHHMHQQITSFEELFPHISEDGVYVCEDLLTSYNPHFGGGWRAEGTFIEMSKGLVDQLNAWWSHERERFDVDWFTRSAYSMHYYDSVLVIEKRRMQRSRPVKRGKRSF
jgi:hypothetical protein